MASIDIQLEKTYTISVVLPELAFVQYRRQKAMKNYIKMDKRQVGVRIWELIDSSAMTIEQISEFLCLSSPRVIYDWMSGKKIPTLERAYNFARLFDTTVEDVFFAQRILSSIFLNCRYIGIESCLGYHKVQNYIAGGNNGRLGNIGYYRSHSKRNQHDCLSDNSTQKRKKCVWLVFRRLNIGWNRIDNCGLFIR